MELAQTIGYLAIGVVVLAILGGLYYYGSQVYDKWRNRNKH